MLLWWKSIRTNTLWLFGIALLVNVGMWLERFVIIVSSLSHEFDPAAWGLYQPSWVEVGITLGSFAWFFLFFLLFVKFLPLVSLAEVKEHLPSADSGSSAVEADESERPLLPVSEAARAGRGAGIVGVFTNPDKLVATVRSLRREGYKNLSVVSPFPSHALEEALGTRKSPIRYFTLVGGLLGCAIGFALPTYTALDWPLQTSAKPIVALPAFAIIAFELTILFGAIATVIGLLINARLPARSVVITHDPRFSEDRFGLLVPCTAEQTTAIRRSITAGGAEEVYGQGV